MPSAMLMCHYFQKKKNFLIRCLTDYNSIYIGKAKEKEIHTVNYVHG